MGPNQDFTVFASSSVNETYSVSVSVATAPNTWHPVGIGNDTTDFVFQTPSNPENEWRYILIVGTSGSYTLDSYYGPEIDAVGWYGQ